MEVRKGHYVQYMFSRQNAHADYEFKLRFSISARLHGVLRRGPQFYRFFNKYPEGTENGLGQI